jgi:glycosyltransferase involved in cell wall biosynthesis
LSERLLLFVPCYQCAPQVRRTLLQLNPSLQRRFAEVLVLDNGSQDGTPDAVLRVIDEHLTEVKVTLGRNDQNYGLGGSHKVAFQYALDAGYDGVVVLHGDDQGHLADLMDVLDQHPEADVVLGARFHPRSRLRGYAAHRIAANIAFNLIFSGLSATWLWDLGSGLNLYRRRFLAQGLWEKCADDLTFNYHLLLRTLCAPDVRQVFVPISWREEDQVSNAKLWRHGRAMLRIVRAFAQDREGFLFRDHSAHPPPRTFTRLHP